MVGGEAGAIPAIARRDAHDADIAEDAVREPFVRCCAAIGARIPRAVITSSNCSSSLRRALQESQRCD